MKHMRRLKTLVKVKDPKLHIDTKRASKARGEDGKTAGEIRGVIRQ